MEVRRAQSRGEWLGVRRTFLEGLLGMELCVGGGKRDDVEDWVVGGPRLGSEERGMEGGGIRPGAGRR